MHGVADGAAGKLVGNEIVADQLFVERIGSLIADDQRVTDAEGIALDKRIVHFGFNIHQRLIDTDHP